MEGKRTHGGCPDKYYCNYTLRFISCERALMGVDGIIYHGTLIKIIIRALNRGENGMGIMFTFPCAANPWSSLCVYRLLRYICACCRIPVYRETQRSELRSYVYTHRLSLLDTDDRFYLIPRKE